MPVSTIADAGLPDCNKIMPWSIWCGERGYEVFADACKNGLRILFRFSIDPSLRRSVQSRIGTCYHELPVKDVAETFPDIGPAREAISSSITKVWDTCSEHPSIKLPDVVVEIYEDADHQCQWSISHMSVFEDYIEQLRPLHQVLNEEIPLDAYETFDTVDIPSLEYHNTLGGRGDTILVNLIPDPDSLLVFKGLDFVKYLQDPSGFHHWRDQCYHEIRTIRSLPPHPNIIPPAITYVTATEMSEEAQQAFICGTLRPYIKPLTLDHQIRNHNEIGKRIPLAAKARWCFQLASAIAHAHHVAHTYHMDIKPTNVLLDDNRDLLLIDWEQSGAPKCTIAPEADGSWDVEKADTGSGQGLGSASLVYKKYDGPTRRNNPFGWPEWNVFPIWVDHYPQALEAAEVYSVGRTMWMLLQQVEQEKDSRAPAVEVYWSRCDFPVKWDVMVNRCLVSDPQKRVTLAELVSFWEAEKDFFDRTKYLKAC